MPENAKVKISYGPYKSCGLVEHQMHRLEGLASVLNLHGHTTTFKEIEDWNAVALEVNGETVYTADIRDLDFGGDGILDPLCKEALKRVTQAY
ncbi:hypothetical protein CAPTEDRAFT_104684 [Capitella teleta]|uniref:Uncharacterized protein n=1 Tax=Capitella teleta TaxID=283909 RepID=R7VH49_CAPTE|nr:hypothetical protein CAPTEDRAFT_104684 [Capitella teleta]|eukprot:ELU17897.1 hypothetical protein CAPTEDRAFT_104684 [Capitella teleta]